MSTSPVGSPATPTKDHLGFYAIFPPAILMLASFLTYGVYFALAAVQPNLVAGISISQLVFGLHLFIALVEWGTAFSVMRTQRRLGGTVRELVSPAVPLRIWQFRLAPALLVMLVINLLMAGMMAVLTTQFGGMSMYAGLAPWQRIFLLLLILTTAPFCEELIWRGYLITRLEVCGHSRWRAISLAALSFALIHGDPVHWLFTFLVGLAAGYYYTRERTLVPLMLAHGMADLWSFGLAFLW